jgi:hypothetical protein
MSDSVRFSDDPATPEEASKSEITLAADIMMAMVKAAKGARMYQPNNPILGRFYQDLTEKMMNHLQLYGEYKLDVEKFELRYKEHVVYANQDAGESMAFRMYSDGIRSFIFSDGVDTDELKDFLAIVTMSSSGDLDDDIVTRLWDRDLPHCQYILEDDFQEAGADIGNECTGGATVGRIPPACLQDPLAVSTPLQAIPPQLYLLSEDDHAALQSLLEAAETIRPLDEVCRILSAILAGVEDTADFSQFLEISRKLVRNLFAAGESGHALKMFAFLYNLSTAKEPSAEKRRLVLQALDRFWTDNAFKGLCTTINTTDAIPADDFKTLSIMIGRTSATAICELLGMVEKMKLRKILIEAVIDIAREKPTILIPGLTDPRWYLARNMVFILTRLKCAALLEQVVPLIAHRDQRVRKEVLHYLITIDEPRAKSYLQKFLRDESPALRLTAVKFFGRARLQFALKPIMAMVDSYEFEELTIADKKAIYEAIGELGGEKVLPLLKALLLKKYLLTTSKEMESVACALAGLLKIPGEGTLKVLEEGLRVKRSEYRPVISQAISQFNQAAAASSAAKEA